MWLHNRTQIGSALIHPALTAAAGLTRVTPAMIKSFLDQGDDQLTGLE
jgi:hypothetical protein